MYARHFPVWSIANKIKDHLFVNLYDLADGSIFLRQNGTLSAILLQ